MLNKGIGMGYVHKAYAAIGTEVFISVRGKLLKAKIVKLPFINPV
jgi:aminomethyltransferase